MKLRIAILFVICFFLFVSCETVNPPESTDTAQTDITSGETTALSPSTTATETSATTDSETEGTAGDVGGEHMGDDLYGPYIGLVDTISFLPDTFSWDKPTSDAVQIFADTIDREDKPDRPALLYYLVHELNLTRADLETYYAKYEVTNVSEEVYAGLLTDDIQEAMQILKEPYTFYFDGGLYTVYDLFEMQKQNALAFDVADSEYNDEWASIKDYIATADNGIQYDPALVDFVASHVKS